MADVGEQSGKSFTIIVKTPKEKQDVSVSADATIREFKTIISAKFEDTPIEQLCLIFAGKILKDDESLKQHGIKDGLTVHLVIKSANRAQEQAAQSSTTTGPSLSQQRPNVDATPFGLGSLGGLQGLQGLGLGSQQFGNLQERMQREMLQNPDMVRQMMSNPIVQQLMENPDVMREIIMSNPQMRELTERNPEIGHMLNNSDMMRQMMEMAQNPSMMAELMRSQDRAMSNLESIPGGFNALQRMYHDIQEPMMSAAQDSMGGNPFASLVNNGSGTGGNSGQQGRENTDPLPNPWAPGGGSSSSTSSSTGTTTTNTSSRAGGPHGMFNTPGMQSLLQQMAQDPQLMNQAFQAPYMQPMLQSLSNNPDLARQVIGNNPMFANDPALQSQLTDQLPVLLQQMQNPAIQRTLSNPAAIEAIMQIQQGMQRLQSEAPELVTGMTGISGLTVPPRSTPSTGTGSGTTTTQSTGTATTQSTTSTTSSGTGTTPTSSSTPSGAPDSQFNTLMTSMLQAMAGNRTGGPGQSPQSSLPPEQQFASQLQQLETMGFINTEDNIRALTATWGDVNAAIDRLLQIQQQNQQRFPGNS
ncbi:ubiquilin-1-like [Lineus longissimus]|uniref:ubiquilin-1-like n=1 Tax=Lineus longissimus TaxID=88925 RepID=UPI002B4C29CC